MRTNRLLIIELLQGYEHYRMTTERPVDIFEYLTVVAYNKIGVQTAFICATAYRALCNAN